MLWDHGGGFRGFRSPEHLTIRNIKGAIDLATVELDFLGFDACLMAMTEVVNELKGCADIYVGSESYEPASGWPYENIIAELNSNPGMSASTLGQTVVSKYGSWWEGIFGGRRTMSCVDLRKAFPLVQALDAFAGAAITSTSPSDWSALRSARDAAED